MPTPIDRCPSCSRALEIRELYCPACELQLRGRFAPEPPGPFARLNAEQQAFLRLFVTSRGNLSDLERTLGVSYPTVRAKLDEVIEALAEQQPPRPATAATPPAPPLPPAVPPSSRREVLAAVAEGRLTVQEGLARLKQRPAET